MVSQFLKRLFGSSDSDEKDSLGLREKGIKTPTFLVGDFGKEVLEEYKDRTKTDYNGNSSLNVLSWYDGKVVGSNPFAVVLVNQIIRAGNLRTATPADLERVLEQKSLDLGSSYNDTALVLRTQCGYNVQLAQHLAKQVKKRNGKFEYPVMIPLVGLDLDDPNSDASKSSDYGLAFKLRDDAQIVYAPELLNENDGQRFSSANDNGLPILRGSGNKTLYTTQFGLVRAYLISGRDFFANCVHLRYSIEFGRVVVVGAAGAAHENSGGNQ